MCKSKYPILNRKLPDLKEENCIEVMDIDENGFPIKTKVNKSDCYVKAYQQDNPNPEMRNCTVRAWNHKRNMLRKHSIFDFEHNIIKNKEEAADYFRDRVNVFGERLINTMSMHAMYKEYTSMKKKYERINTVKQPSTSYSGNTLEEFL